MKVSTPSCAAYLASLLAVLLCTVATSQETAPEVTWRRSDADSSKYSKILIKPLDLSDVKVLKPVWEQDDPEDWSFTPGSAESIQRMFMEIMMRELSNNDGIQVVTEAGEAVLQLEMEFLSITPYVKPGATDVDGYVVETLGSGDIVLSAELRDSQTGELLLLVEGERKIGTEYKELSRESHIANLEETFSTWGQRLREYLQSAQSD